MKRILFLLTLTTSCAQALCQVPDFEPAQELKNLGWMVGDWVGTGTFTMPDMPDMEVTVTFKAEWDGQFIKQTAVNDFGMIQMTETMMLGYDSKKGEYFSHSFSNMAPLPRIERGKITDGALVMVSEPWEVMGDAGVSRATMTHVDDDTCKMKLEFKVGEGWSTVTEMTFKRKV